jgi:hypothetical protein
LVVLENVNEFQFSLLRLSCFLVVYRDSDHWMENVYDVMMPMNYAGNQNRMMMMIVIHVELKIFVEVEQ